MTLSTEDFDFDLPEELIAQTPLANRENIKLLTLDRRDGKLTDVIFLIS